MTGFLIILCMSRNLFDNLLKALDSSQKNKNFFTYAQILRTVSEGLQDPP